MDRRAFLASLPAVTVAGHALLTARRRLDGFGVQLYTLRSVAPSDVDGTLAAVAEIGYAFVEFAGLYGLEPADMRHRLDRVGLRAASSHVSLDEVRGDWGAVLESAQELGQDLIVVPSLPGDVRSPDGLRRVADELNRAGELARAAGLRLGYHNHDWELRPLPDGSRPIDVLLDRTQPSLVDWQMDVFWAVHGGADPMEELRSRAGRVTSVHVKDRTADGEMVDVGDGVIDFATILPAAERQGLVHAFVEHDNPGDAIESVRRSFQHLNALRR